MIYLFSIDYNDRSKYIDFSWDKPLTDRYICVEIFESEWSDEYYLSFNREINKWCIENNISYKIVKHNDCDTIRNILFKNIDDLLLFKLTWAGL